MSDIKICSSDRQIIMYQRTNSSNNLPNVPRSSIFMLRSLCPVLSSLYDVKDMLDALTSISSAPDRDSLETGDLSSHQTAETKE